MQRFGFFSPNQFAKTVGDLVASFKTALLLTHAGLYNKAANRSIGRCTLPPQTFHQDGTAAEPRLLLNRLYIKKKEKKKNLT